MKIDVLSIFPEYFAGPLSASLLGRAVASGLLTVAVTDHTEAHPYDHWERRIRFEVRQTNIYDVGSVYMPSTFTSETRRRTTA